MQYNLPTAPYGPTAEGVLAEQKSRFRSCIPVDRSNSVRVEIPRGIWSPRVRYPAKFHAVDESRSRSTADRVAFPSKAGALADNSEPLPRPCACSPPAECPHLAIIRHPPSLVCLRFSRTAPPLALSSEKASLRRWVSIATNHRNARAQHWL